MGRITRFDRPAHFVAAAAVGGREEELSPFSSGFDFFDPTDRFGADTWEKAEGEMGRLALNFAMKRAHLRPRDISVLFAGDLQNQCVASAAGLFSFGIPYIGLYGACSTCTEALLSAAFYHEATGGYCAAVTTSHNSAAERQFRTPLEYGSQRTPTAQWTATAAGAFLLGDRGDVLIAEAMPGKIIDGAISDASNMGAAMAPAAADTVLTYFRETGADPRSFDRVVTGDLGDVGSALFSDLLTEGGLSGIAHDDCGSLLYDKEKQDAHAGASGCGTSASVLASHFLGEIASGRMKDVLFLSTGALMSPTSVAQGEHIFGIAPLIRIKKA